MSEVMCGCVGVLACAACVCVCVCLLDRVAVFSENGDSDPVHLCRDRELHQQPDEPQEAPSGGGEMSAGAVQRRRVVFFSCRVGAAIDTDRESQELKAYSIDVASSMIMNRGQR